MVVEFRSKIEDYGRIIDITKRGSLTRFVYDVFSPSMYDFIECLSAIMSRSFTNCTTFELLLQKMFIEECTASAHCVE